jgi:uncharacterized protein
VKLNLTVLQDTFAICRFDKNAPIPDWIQKEKFYSITRTSDELSIVCTETNAQTGEKIDKGWKAFKVEGPLDFSLVGILSNLSGILTDGGVSIFVISTYDTDYILVKKENLENAADLFTKAGHIVTYQ